MRRNTIWVFILTLVLCGLAVAVPQQIRVPRPVAITGMENISLPQIIVPRYQRYTLDDTIIGSRYQMGTSWNDLQANGTAGKQIAVDHDGFVHNTWTNGLNWVPPRATSITMSGIPRSTDLFCQVKTIRLVFRPTEETVRALQAWLSIWMASVCRYSIRYWYPAAIRRPQARLTLSPAQGPSRWILFLCLPVRRKSFGRTWT